MPEPERPATPPGTIPEPPHLGSPGPSVGHDTDETAGEPVVAAPPAFAPPAAPGEVGTLGPYRVVRSLGRGGMGAVYLAVDTRLDRPVALKVMLPRFAAVPAARERFLREARAAAKVTHDNVVTVYEADERDGVPYIAMQLLQGYSLEEYLKTKGNLTVPQVLRVAREVAAGLAAAHAIGLVHRDIKPANLWLEAPEGRVKVLDFGLARPVDAEAELTREGAVVGTPAYMSPEQARGAKVDPRTDLFSLGVVLYRLCAGRTPFRGPNVMAVLMALGTEEPTPLRELNPVVPESLADLIARLLAKNPDGRPQTAGEVVTRVAAVEDELAVPMAEVADSAPDAEPVQYVAIPVTIQPGVDAFARLDATEADPTTPAAQVPRSPRKEGGVGIWAAAILTVLIALGILAGVIHLLQRKPETAGGGTPDDVVTKPKKDATPKAKPVPPIPADPDRAAAEWVLSLGGWLDVRDKKANKFTKGIKTAADLPANPFILTAVSLTGTAVTDAGLANLKGLSKLSDISLSRTAVSDAGLAHLAGLGSLSNLNLTGTAVTDAGLAHLKDCRGLGTLNLENTGVTDAGLAHLKDLRGLTGLDLDGTAVTDAGLLHLKDIGKLTLYVSRTKVTRAGLREFHALVPSWFIQHDGGTIKPVKE